MLAGMVHLPVIVTVHDVKFAPLDRPGVGQRHEKPFLLRL